MTGLNTNSHLLTFGDSVSWRFLFYESCIFWWIAVRYNVHLSPRAAVIVTCFTLSRMRDMHLVILSSLSATVYLMIHYTSPQIDDSWNITGPPSIHRRGTPREKWPESKLSVLNNSHTLSSTHNSGGMPQPCISSSPSHSLRGENKKEKSDLFIFKLSVLHFDGTRGIILEHLDFLPSQLFPPGSQNKPKKRE